LRLLAASDIHGNQDFYRRLPALARETGAAAVVLAGDLLGFPDGFETLEEAQRADAQEILHHLEPLDVPLFYIMGNDDWVDLNSLTAAVQSVHGRRCELGAYNLVGYQYSLPFMGGIYERSEEAIASDLALLEPHVDSNTVLMTHGPAHGILDATLLGPAGSIAVRDLVVRRRVRAHLHGHVHECFGRQDRHFNVAAGRAMRAMLIALDTLEHQIIELR
jgi:Icc-related predicted phosphoesterase